MKKAPVIFGNKTKYAGLVQNRRYHKARKAARLRKAAEGFRDGRGFIRKVEYDLSLTPEEVRRIECTQSVISSKE
jgi:hypothetical protein